jgi:phenylalanyl-tRNA synthetase alpha chain
VKGSLGKVADIEARKELGQAVNEALNSLQRASDLRSRELRTGEFATQINADRVDMTELAMSAQASQRRGRMHLVTQATERLEDVFIGLVFQIAE